MRKLFLAFALFFIMISAQAEEMHEVKLTVVYVDSVHEIPVPITSKFGYAKGYELGSAFVKDDVCKIYVLKPASRFDTKRMEILGHEVMHCTNGAYHN